MQKHHQLFTKMRDLLLSKPSFFAFYREGNFSCVLPHAKCHIEAIVGTICDDLALTLTPTKYNILINKHIDIGGTGLLLH